MDSGSRSLMTVAAATLLFIPVMFYMLQRKRKSAMKTVAKVEKILVYPIKSCPPLVVDQAECTPVGMKYRKARDRQFMLVKKGSYERMGLKNNISLNNISLTYDEKTDCLNLEASGMATTLTVPLGFPNYDPSQVKAVMWFDGSRKKFVEVGEDASDWFSKYLNKEALLVTTHPDLMSEVNPQLTYSEAARVERHKGTRVTFEGTHPYLLISQNSINDLNTRISEHVTNDSFRGNIVLSGSAELTPLHAYEEENWKRVRIGAEAMMHTEKPCSRCPTIQIDFEKLELRKNKEPTTTLLRYHRGTRGKDKYTPVFGVNCSLIQEGVVSVGDLISVTY